MRYTPNLPSAASVILRIQSNDPNESDFDIKLTGSGRWPTHLESWRWTYFLTPYNQGPGADTNDSDHDRVVNLMEYAYGLNPTNSASALLPAPQFTNGDFAIVFASQPLVTEITYRVEWTPSLTGTWSFVTNSATGTNHYFGVPVSGHDHLFFRHSISHP